MKNDENLKQEKLIIEFVEIFYVKILIDIFISLFKSFLSIQNPISYNEETIT